MKTRLFAIASLIVLLLSAVTQVAFACPVCGTPSKVTISGPGIEGMLVVKDAKVTASLGVDQFFGAENRQPIVPPANPGGGYDLYRSWDYESDHFGNDHLRYYPNASGAGTIFYTRDSLELAKQIGMENMIDHWFAATTPEDAIMQRVFKSINITPQASTSTASATIASPTSSSVSIGWPIGLVVGAGIMIGGLLVYKRRRVRSNIVT